MNNVRPFFWTAINPQPDRKGNHVAGEGEVWVCTACGKRSQDRYGFQKIDRG